ncbi:hypothetical protein BN903_241 [Halorubrum sp. AJ67]|nr:hypothetical protein BN903_241 [Halorubrum sp. AJ67]
MGHVRIQTCWITEDGRRTDGDVATPGRRADSGTDSQTLNAVTEYDG